jgi:RNA polymerase sigma factor (sigma-70 family)
MRHGKRRGAGADLDDASCLLCLGGRAEALVALHRRCCWLAARHCEHYGFLLQDAEDLGSEFYYYLVAPPVRLKKFLKRRWKSERFGQWLGRQCLTFLRDRARGHHPGRCWNLGLEAQALAAATGSDVEAAALNELEQERLCEAALAVLQELDPEDRRLLCERHLLELGYGAMAGERGLRPATIRKRYERLRRRLDERVRKLNVTFCGRGSS